MLTTCTSNQVSLHPASSRLTHALCFGQGYLCKTLNPMTQPFLVRVFIGSKPTPLPGPVECLQELGELKIKLIGKVL